MAEIVLYDIPTRATPPVCWSPNPWKARMALNFKGLAYTTQWVEYPDIAPTLKAKGVSAAEPPATAYSCPTVSFPDGLVVMDSLKIAHEIEKRNPQPSLHLDSPVLTQVFEVYAKIWPHLSPVVLPQVPRNLLGPESIEYFQRTRAERFGMSLDQFEKSKGGQAAWDSAGPFIAELAGLLKQNREGPFFLGISPSFADFVIAGMIEFLQRLNKQNYEQFVAQDAAFKDLHDACRRWIVRDD